jgi:hypothetical protein
MIDATLTAPAATAHIDYTPRPCPDLAQRLAKVYEWAREAKQHRAGDAREAAPAVDNQGEPSNKERGGS